MLSDINKRKKDYHRVLYTFNKRKLSLDDGTSYDVPHDMGTILTNYLNHPSDRTNKEFREYVTNPDDIDAIFDQNEHLKKTKNGETKTYFIKEINVKENREKILKYFFIVKDKAQYFIIDSDESKEELKERLKKQVKINRDIFLKSNQTPQKVQTDPYWEKQKSVLKEIRENIDNFIGNITINNIFENNI